MEFLLSLVGQERGLVADILSRGRGSRVLGIESEEGGHGCLEDWRLDDLGGWRGGNAGNAAGARLRRHGGATWDHGAVGEKGVCDVYFGGRDDNTRGGLLRRFGIEREECGGEGDAEAGGRHFLFVVGGWGWGWCGKSVWS